MNTKSNISSELKEEIMQQGAVFEHDYGRKIDAIYEKLMLNDEINKEKEKFILN